MASKSSIDRPGSRLGRIGIITLISSTSVLRLDQLDVQAEALQLLEQHVERFGEPRLQQELPDGPELPDLSADEMEAG